MVLDMLERDGLLDTIVVVFTDHGRDLVAAPNALCTMPESMCPLR